MRMRSMKKYFYWLGFKMARLPKAGDLFSGVWMWQRSRQESHFPVFVPFRTRARFTQGEAHTCGQDRYMAIPGKKPVFTIRLEDISSI
jgi:hypothetical protein